MEDTKDDIPWNCAHFQLVMLTYSAISVFRNWMMGLFESIEHDPQCEWLDLSIAYSEIVSDSTRLLKLIAAR